MLCQNGHHQGKNKHGHRGHNNAPQKREVQVPLRRKKPSGEGAKINDNPLQIFLKFSEAKFQIRWKFNSARRLAGFIIFSFGKNARGILINRI